MLQESSIHAFLEALASESPAPGGGGAGGVSAAMGAALVAMTARFTVGKKNYVEYDGEMQRLIARADELRVDAAKIIDDDATAFGLVAAAYKLPRATDAEKTARTQAIQNAMKEACQPPLRLAVIAREVLEMSLPAAEHGNVNLVSDAAAAAHLAQAALQIARLNAEINFNAIKDEDFVRQGRARLDAALIGAGDLVDHIDRTTTQRGG